MPSIYRASEKSAKRRPDPGVPDDSDESLGGGFLKSAPFMLKQDLIFIDRRGLILFGSISMEMGINKKKESLFRVGVWGGRNLGNSLYA